ncbi:IQ domain-containing protein E isoform X2 [Myotis yumanensis]|uniref:IQ domain-containing protein E isoform X2 n=1 Tax=Myotis yumanensis TaxID=159337 RepID=UPI0038D11A31
MSLGTGDPASETGDDSLSAITFDSDFETKTKRKSVHKPPPTSPKSPYHCKPRTAASGRPPRTAASMPLGSRTPLTPQRLWLGSAKQGLAPGTPVYREKEDMYDEIMDLKKSLHMQRSDADLLRTKLRRLEEENSRKDRQIEQLLDPSRGPDFVWTLGEKRPDAGWVISGLKQRVLRLEQQCKDKDSTISKLQADMKTTSLEEMRIVMETYYEEIHRLQTLLASSEPSGRKPAGERKAGLRRQRKLSGALLSLSRSVQELTEENQSLKEDLDRVLSSSPTVARTKGCVEWSKPRLLRRIAELEKKIRSLESPPPQASDGGRSDALALCASSTWGHRQPLPEPQEDGERHQDSERQDDSERLRGALRSLKGERKALRAQLQERDLEVRQLLQAKADVEKELEEVRRGEEARRAREAALREEIQALTRKCQDLQAAKEAEEDDPTEGTPEAPEEPQPGPAGSPSPQDSLEPGAGEDSPSQPCACSEQRRHAAASTLQAQWKVYRRQKREAALDEVSRRPWCSRQPSADTWLGRGYWRAQHVVPDLPVCPASPARALPHPALRAPLSRPRATPGRRRPSPSSSRSSGHTWHGSGTGPGRSLQPLPGCLFRPHSVRPPRQRPLWRLLPSPLPRLRPGKTSPRMIRTKSSWLQLCPRREAPPCPPPWVPAGAPHTGTLCPRKARLAGQSRWRTGPDTGKSLTFRERTGPALPRHLRLLVWLVCVRPERLPLPVGQVVAPARCPVSTWRCQGPHLRGQEPPWPEGRGAPSVGARAPRPPAGAWCWPSLTLPAGPVPVQSRGTGKPRRCCMIPRRPPPEANLCVAVPLGAPGHGP